MQGLGSLLIKEVSERVINHLKQEKKNEQIIEELKQIVKAKRHIPTCLSCDIPYVILDSPIHCPFGLIYSCGRVFCNGPVFIECVGCKELLVEHHCNACADFQKCKEKNCTNCICEYCSSDCFWPCGNCGDEFCEDHTFTTMFYHHICKSCSIFANADDEEEMMELVGLEGDFYVEIIKK